MEKIKKIMLFIILVQLVTIFLLGFTLTCTLSRKTVYPIVASAIVWREGSNYYAANASGIQFSGANASWVIQSAIDSLNMGRTWKEKSY
ncbi:MAG: hypothetical protein ACPLRY_03200 [Candidatus Bathyarchaeales archaeon]